MPVMTIFSSTRWAGAACSSPSSTFSSRDVGFGVPLVACAAGPPGLVGVPCSTSAACWSSAVPCTAPVVWAAANPPKAAVRRRDNAILTRFLIVLTPSFRSIPASRRTCSPAKCRDRRRMADSRNGGSVLSPAESSGPLARLPSAGQGPSESLVSRSGPQPRMRAPRAGRPRGPGSSRLDRAALRVADDRPDRVREERHGHLRPQPGASPGAGAGVHRHGRSGGAVRRAQQEGGRERIDRHLPAAAGDRPSQRPQDHDPDDLRQPLQRRGRRPGQGGQPALRRRDRPHLPRPQLPRVPREVSFQGAGDLALSHGPQAGDRRRLVRALPRGLRPLPDLHRVVLHGRRADRLHQGALPDGEGRHRHLLRGGSQGLSSRQLLVVHADGRESLDGLDPFEGQHARDRSGPGRRPGHRRRAAPVPRPPGPHGQPRRHVRDPSPEHHPRPDLRERPPALHVQPDRSLPGPEALQPRLHLQPGLRRPWLDGQERTLGSRAIRS